ncbi:MAG: hypothetical protein MZV63_14375 [Marinilabiliales bacterium]|nr:hypothetical protein [Marinilabiliales bacterium]
MRDLMGPDLIDEFREIRTEPHHVPGRAVDEREIREIHERRPRLAGEPRRLPRDGDPLVVQGAERTRSRSSRCWPRRRRRPGPGPRCPH